MTFLGPHMEFTDGSFHKLNVFLSHRLSFMDMYEMSLTDFCNKQETIDRASEPGLLGGGPEVLWGHQRHEADPRRASLQLSQPFFPASPPNRPADREHHCFLNAPLSSHVSCSRLVLFLPLLF